MSLITISSLERITAPKLAEILLAADTTAGNQSTESKIAIVDVRDDGVHTFCFSFPLVTLRCSRPS
jgi:hypothetical protein